MKITRFGHAALLVEVADARVLIDPGTFSPDETFELERLDAIVVTHQHADHVDRQRIAGLLSRNTDAVLVCDPETAATLEHGEWQPNADGLETIVKGVSIRGVGSQHAEIMPALPRVANVGVLVTAEGEATLFHPGDTYEHAPSDVDVLALPLSAPWSKVSETVEFVTRVAPSTLLPIHDCTISEPAYGIYWRHVVDFGGVEDSRKLGQRDSTDVCSSH